VVRVVLGSPPQLPATLVREVTDKLLEPIYSDWFRTTVTGSENIPHTGPALVVANHAGAFAIDGLMAMIAVAKNSNRSLRVLGADFLFHLGINDILQELGVRPATPIDAKQLLDSGELVGVWPEGVRGVAKTFDQRYRLQRFGRGGLARVAIELQVPVIPTAIIGSEESYPLVGRVHGLLNWIGLPYLPVTPTFPALGPLGLIPLPAHWSISFGTALIPPTDTSVIEVFEFTDHIQSTIREMLYHKLATRSQVF
jgi:1-acyl-sn-glycerol-3-phosphate acyltransferase